MTGRTLGSYRCGPNGEPPEAGYVYPRNPPPQGVPVYRDGGGHRYWVNSAGTKIWIDAPKSEQAAPNAPNGRAVAGAVDLAKPDEGKGLQFALLKAKLLDDEAVEKLPPPSFLIDGILVDNSLAFLYGQPGHGKSFLALDWGLSLATGTDWFGRTTVTGDVLYVAAEGADGQGVRLRAWKEAHGVEGRVERMRWLPVSVNLLNKEWATGLAELVDHLAARLVIIDTLARSMVGGSDSNDKDVGIVIDAAEKLRESTAATVLIVHHTTKDGMNFRGSSAIEGAATSMLWVKPATGGLALHVEKQKDHARTEPIPFAIEVVGESCVLRSHGGDGTSEELLASETQLLKAAWDSCGTEGLATSNLLEVSGLAKSSFYRAKKVLVNKGALVNVGTTRQPRWAVGEEVDG